MVRKLLVSSLLVFVSFFLIITPALAQDKDSENTILPSGEVITRDYFVANETVQILGTVNGDVYVAGGKVIINGVVNGDVIAAGGVVTIGGLVTQDVRSVGGTVQIVGTVTKNVTVAAGTILVSPEARVGGNMLIFGGNTELDGTINGNINVFSQNLTVTNATIHGNVDYWSDREALVSGDAAIKGQLNRHETNTQTRRWKNNANAAGKGAHLASSIISLFTTLIVGLLLIKLFPKYVKRSEDILHKEFGKAFIRGSLALFIIPVVLFLLMITIIGIPLAFIGAIIFMTYLYVGRIFALIALGGYILKRTKSNESLNMSFVIGLLVYFILGLIPVIGGLVAFIVAVIGLGTAVTNDRRTWAISRGSHIL